MSTKRFECKLLQDTMETDLPPPKWAVPGLLSEGLTILSGKPKTGKSWLSLGIALNVALGGKALGTRQTEQGDVLYLALEDKERRIKDRVLKMLPGLDVGGKLDRFHLVTESPPQNDGGIESVAEWMQSVSRPSLCVIDVWAKFRPVLLGNSQNYAADMYHAGVLKKVADDHSCPVLIVHHTRKGTSDDFLEETSGTNGLAGAADTPMVLHRARMEKTAKLQITGRDVEERAIPLRFVTETCNWVEVLDPAEEVLGDLQSRILSFLNRRTEWTTWVEIYTGLKHDKESVRTTLRKMVSSGRLVKESKPPRFKIAM